MKKLLLVLFVTCGIASKAQVYNNEWIQDYSKTYYKFKVGKTGLYRITQAVLSAAGLGAAGAEQFQLWRNGKQVPLYTSAPSGVLPANGFIEFWGQMNDGKADKELYRQPTYQLNDKWSLETDTAAYFLTINTNAAANLRLAPSVNNVAGNVLTAEPYFMYTAGTYYRAKINSGYAVNVGENMYSSSYDRGEGWSSADIGKNGNITTTLNNLNVFSGGPAAKLIVGASGNAINPRRYRVTINADSVAGKTLDFFSHSSDTFSFNLATIATNTAAITLENITNCGATGICPPSDRMVVHRFEINYPRQFNFDGANSFEFSLPASATGNFLQISNFGYGAATPVLYDITNGKRYNADMTAAPLLKFALPPSPSERNLVLASVDAAHTNTVAVLQARNFINYSNPANVGDYLIISHPLLMTGGANNPVEDYRAYRSSAVGGGFNAKIYLADELIDQFGFGIKKNPAGIRNFIRFARNTYPVAPKNIFIIGHGVNYRDHRAIESASAVDQQNLERLDMVPPFGWPASDALLAADPGSSQPKTPIGRLSVVTPQEVTTYLNKVIEFEQAQKTVSPAIADKAWQKNFVHIVGAGDNDLGNLLTGLMRNYEQTIEDTLYGANVSTFSKTSSNAVEQLTSGDLSKLFNDGISVITYFGHSSATTLEFNLDNPENYNNQGKYPMFIGLGCNAGNFFNYSPNRFITKETISEKYVLAPNRGTIGFIASTHFGIVHYLDTWNARAYKRIAHTSYGKSIGQIMLDAIEDVFNVTTQEDFYARANAEETALHGDPAVTLNPHPKPDYVIEPQMVKTSPAFISVADANFKVDVKVMNIGKAPKNFIVVEVKQQLPNGNTFIVKRDTIAGVKYMDSLSVTVPINPSLHKGLNKITVTVDPDNAVNELFETNNSVSKDVMIFEDEARPIYPYNFAIINKVTTKFTASTANPFSPSKQYQMEIDTTELFNSSFKQSLTISSKGGLMEFAPAINFTDSTVYFWRVAPVPASGPFAWNTASFIYLPNTDPGFNQSHLHQHFKSSGQRIALDSASKLWKYGKIDQNLFIRNGTWVTSGTQEGAFSVAINADPVIRLTCWFQSLVFNVFDGGTLKPLFNEHLSAANATYPTGLGLFNSATPSCLGQAIKKWNFEYRYTDTSSRRKIMDFMSTGIPDGSYVVVRSFTLDPASFPSFPVAYAADWAADTAIHGSGKSLYHYLKNAGLSSIDSLYRARPFSFVYKKGDPTFQPRWVMGEGVYDNQTLSVDCPTTDTIGYISSPKFGPAKAWKELKWRGTAMEATPGDNPTLSIIGFRNNGTHDTLFRNLNLSQQTFDISSVNAAQYPFLQVHMRNVDSVTYTPYQLRYWRFTYVPAPEGAVAPNIFFSMKDTVDVAEPLEFKMAFKNISDAPFPDSLKVKIIVTDRNNVTRTLPTFKQRSLPINDTINIRFPVDTRQLVGNNNMYVEVNPDFDQPEQYHFNNFFYKEFYVRGDTLNPLLDVTFDNVRILNEDIVSARPNILIKLKDEAKWFMMTDTGTVKVQIQFPDSSLRDYHFDGATMQFIPAQAAPSNNNTATVNLKPDFNQDGKYTMLISAKDMSQNRSGAMQYRVSFNVFKKPMISNMLNYPNPFTTSTAFVFTITGSEVPQNIRIQILTVTGKVVREITKDELGPLHIGRNITEFKWNGTDQYGQSLANGVYLYRVITNLNGKSLEKFTDAAREEKTDQYFNKGYGKMYLMR